MGLPVHAMTRRADRKTMAQDSHTATDLAASLADAARAMGSPRDLESAERQIVLVAQKTIPHMEHVSISVRHRDGTVETRAATDDFARQMDALQQELQEGPCLQALDAEELVVANRPHADRHWPRYLPRAVAEGLRSQVGVRLFVDRTTLGGLNLYSTSSQTVDHDAGRLALMFATHAALALDRATMQQNLQQALSTRTKIGQAIGIVMERYQLDEQRAFSYLVRMSQDRNVKLREVAGDLVAESLGANGS